MRAAYVLIIYAVALIAAGVFAFVSAPEDAKAITALIVPGACAVVIGLLAIGMLALPFLRARRALHITALAFMLIFAGAFAVRAMSASSAARSYRNAADQLERAVEAGEVEDTPEAREAFFGREDAPDHDKSYLANTLWILVAISALALVAGIVFPPKPTTNRDDG